MYNSNSWSAEFRGKNPLSQISTNPTLHLSQLISSFFVCIVCIQVGFKGTISRKSFAKSQEMLKNVKAKNEKGQHLIMNQENFVQTIKGSFL